MQIVEKYIAETRDDETSVTFVSADVTHRVVQQVDSPFMCAQKHAHLDYHERTINCQILKTFYQKRLDTGCYLGKTPMMVFERNKNRDLGIATILPLFAGKINISSADNAVSLGEKFIEVWLETGVPFNQCQAATHGPKERELMASKIEGRFSWFEEIESIIYNKMCTTCHKYLTEATPETITPTPLTPRYIKFSPDFRPIEADEPIVDLPF